MNLDKIIREVQKALNVGVDGKPGPETWAAIYAQVVGKPVPTSKSFAGPVDARSEATLKTLLPEVVPYARSLVRRAADAGIEIKVISGTRSYAEQNALFAQGRTKPGRRVTNAKGGESNHNFGIAFDIGVFEGRKYLGESPAYDVVGLIGTEIGLEWGGHWTSFADKPHYQLRPQWAALLSSAELLAGLRARISGEQPVYA